MVSLHKKETTRWSIAVKNFRELGGIKNIDGRAVKGGKLFRGSALCVEGEDKKTVVGLKPDCIIDFRCAEEVRGNKDFVPDGCSYIFAPVFAQKNNPYIAVTLSAKLRTIFLCGKRLQKLYDDKLNSYRNFPFAAAYKRLFERMDEGDTIIFHCTAGKDRTGFAAALALFALGCDKETVMADYLLSNEVSPAADRSALKYLGLSKAHVEAIAYCESVHRELLEAALSEITAKYADIDKYLEAEYGVTAERRENYKKLYLE